MIQCVLLLPLAKDITRTLAASRNGLFFLLCYMRCVTYSLHLCVCTHKDPTHYVNGSFIVWHLVDVVSKGGLMQVLPYRFSVIAVMCTLTHLSVPVCGVDWLRT